MDNTPNLQLPYLMAAQAQKHVTHNEALRALDAIVQLTVKDRDLAAPPATPADGDRYLVAAAASGAWAGHDGAIAAFQDNAWMLYAPRAGWLAWVADEHRLVAFDGSQWSEVSGGGAALNPADGGLVGINTTADASNRLAVKADAVLLSHDDVTPGSGDMRAKLNKAAAGNTATLLFQDNWSGRAEIGLAGDDDFHFKVSADGASWKDAITINRATGAVAMPFTSLGSGGSGSDDPNSSLHSLLLAGLVGDLVGLTDGIADPFSNQNGVATLTNCTLANGAITPTSTGGGNQIPTMTAATTSGVTMSATSEYNATWAAWKAADAVLTTGWLTLVNPTLPVYLTVNFVTARTIASYAINAVNGTNYVNTPTAWELQGWTGSAWVTIDTRSGQTWTQNQKRSYDVASPGAYTKYQIKATAVATTNYVCIGEVELITAGTYGNLTVLSSAFAAAASPTTGRLWLLVKPTGGAIVPNTDLVGAVSRDGGTTWSTATLTQRAALADGTLLLADDALSLAGQPTGQSMKWQLQTANNKALQLTGAALRWK
jgi:hypothetical protein